MKMVFMPEMRWKHFKDVLVLKKGTSLYVGQKIAIHTRPLGQVGTCARKSTRVATAIVEQFETNKTITEPTRASPRDAVARRAGWIDFADLCMDMLGNKPSNQVCVAVIRIVERRDIGQEGLESRDEGLGWGSGRVGAYSEPEGKT